MQKKVRISGFKGSLQIHLTFANLSRFCDQVGFERLTEFEMMYIVLKTFPQKQSIERSTGLKLQFSMDQPKVFLIAKK